MRKSVCALSALGVLIALAVPMTVAVDPAAAAAAPVAGWFHSVGARMLFSGRITTATHAVLVTSHAGVPGSGVRAVDVRVDVSAATKPATVALSPTAAAKRPVLTVAKGMSASTTATVPITSGSKVYLSVSTGAADAAVTVLGWYGGNAGAGLSPSHAAVVAKNVSVRPGHPRWLTVAAKSVTELQAQVLATAGAHAADLTLPTTTLALAKRSNTTTALDLPLGSGSHAGQVRVAAAHGPVTVSIAGLGRYTPAGAQVLHPVSMAALSGPKSLAAGKTATVPVAGHSGVPASGASAVAVSVTATSASRSSAVTAFGGSDARPSLATLLVAKGKPAAGWTVVPLGHNGTIKMYNRAGTVGLHLAVQGWFGPSATPPTAQPGGSPDAATLAGLTAGAGSPQVLAEPPVTGRDVAFGVNESVFSKTIGSDGGSLTVQYLAPDYVSKITLTLTIPAGALAFDTPITAHVITDVPGASAIGATGYGLQLEPTGLVLMRPATLTVVPPGGVQPRAAIGAEASDDGSVTHPTWLMPEATSFTEPVEHFSDHTILVADSASGFTGQYFTGAEYTATIQGRIAQVTEQARESALNNQDFDLAAHLEPIMDEYYANTVTPIVQGSAGSCDTYESSYSTALSYEHTLDVLGVTNQQQSTAITAGMAAGLQNCWEERTKDCMVMDPKRWGELLWIAGQMQILGVERAGGGAADPQDSNQVHWCNPVNGYLTVTYSTDRRQDANGPEIDESNTYTYWITGEYTVNRGSGGGYTITFTDKGTGLTLAYSFLRMRVYHEYCMNMAKATKSLNDAPMPVSGSQTFGAGGTLQTNTGWSAPNAHWQVPETVTDPCDPPSPESVDLHADIDAFTHTEQIDKADEAYLFSGTQDTVVDGADVHQTIAGRLHLENLTKVLG